MNTLTFHVEQSPAQAGQALSGFLEIKLIRSVQCTKIDMYFRGGEYTTIHTGHGHHKFRKTHTAEVNKVSINLDPNKEATRRLVNQGTMASGTYKIPFRINLPKDLPSSMIATRGESTKFDSAKIQYFLTGVLRGSGALFEFETKQEVAVEAKPAPEETVPIVLEPKIKDIYRFQMFDNGEMSIGAKVLDAQLVPGQRLGLVLSIMNDSGAVPERVNVALQRIVTFQTPDSTDETRSIPTTIIDKDFIFARNHIKPLDRKERKELQENINVRREENYHKIMAQLNSKQFENQALSLPPVPQDTTESYAGTNIRVSYILVLAIKTTDTFTNPEIKMPVTMAPRALLRRAGRSRMAEATPNATANAPVPMAAAELFNDESTQSFVSPELDWFVRPV